jgi:hypothetical protein
MKRVLLFTIFITSIFLAQPFAGSQLTNTRELPSYFSWTNIDGIDYSTPVKNQAPAPTCESYALCASLEAKLQYEAKELYNPDLSETHLYFYAGGSYRSGYVNIEDAADYLINYGVPDEGCYPDPHRPFDYPYTSVEGWENRTVKITEWGWVERDEDAIKSALIEYGPLPACFTLYKDFNYYTGGIYTHTFGGRRGGHVMTIFGYDDKNQCWIIKNSGGADWGEDGYVRMHYDSTYFAEWYGEGTGVMYIDGCYGNLNPNVPKVYITSPKIFHSYVFEKEFSQLFRNFASIQKGAPRIIGPVHLKISAENTEKIDIYVDDELDATLNTIPFEINMDLGKGLHTITALAYDANGNVSRDILDVFTLF